MLTGAWVLRHFGKAPGAAIVRKVSAVCRLTCAVPSSLLLSSCFKFAAHFNAAYSVTAAHLTLCCCRRFRASWTVSKACRQLPRRAAAAVQPALASQAPPQKTCPLPGMLRRSSLGSRLSSGMRHAAATGACQRMHRLRRTTATMQPPLRPLCLMWVSFLQGSGGSSSAMGQQAWSWQSATRCLAAAGPAQRRACLPPRACRLHYRPRSASSRAGSAPPLRARLAVAADRSGGSGQPRLRLASARCLRSAASGAGLVVSADLGCCPARLPCRAAVPPCLL